jgi:hypothetical protein
MVVDFRCLSINIVASQFHSLVFEPLDRRLIDRPFTH